MKITIEVPTVAYLYPLATALDEYASKRKKSNDAELHAWALAMRDIKAQVIKQRDSIQGDEIT